MRIVNPEETLIWTVRFPIKFPLLLPINRGTFFRLLFSLFHCHFFFCFRFFCFVVNLISVAVRLFPLFPFDCLFQLSCLFIFYSLFFAWFRICEAGIGVLNYISILIVHKCRSDTVNECLIYVNFPPPFFFFFSVLSASIPHLFFNIWLSPSDRLTSWVFNGLEMPFSLRKSKQFRQRVAVNMVSYRI